MSLEEAKKTGAMALFGENTVIPSVWIKWVISPQSSVAVLMLQIPARFPHLRSYLSPVIAAGVRRIEALTSDALYAYYDKLEEIINEAAALLKTNAAGLTEKITHLQAEVKELHSENESLKSKAAQDALGDVMDRVEEVNGVKLLATALEDVDMNGLRDLGDQLKEKLGEGVVVLASANEGKVSLIAMATEGAMKQGAHAGNLIKAIAAKVGGGGGGRPNMAQAGGKNPAGIPDAIAAAKEALAGQIK